MKDKARIERAVSWTGEDYWGSSDGMDHGDGGEGQTSDLETTR